MRFSFNKMSGNGDLWIPRKVYNVWMVSGLACHGCLSQLASLHFKLPEGLNRDKQWRLTFLAERQICLNKISERASCFRNVWKKCLAIGECVHTTFIHSIQIFAWKVPQRYLTNYSYLSKEQSGAQKLQRAARHRRRGLGENSGTGCLFKEWFFNYFSGRIVLLNKELPSTIIQFCLYN